jgi:ribosomal 50S subunit-recycling heat shock protein
MTAFNRLPNCLRIKRTIAPLIKPIRIKMKLTMPETKAVRIDKFLWSVRIYKTRTIATEACKKGRIIINDIQVKPSRIISAGEIIVVKKPPVSFTFRVN